MRLAQDLAGATTYPVDRACPAPGAAIRPHYAANLLEKYADGTSWISQAGRERLLALSGAVVNYGLG